MSEKPIIGMDYNPQYPNLRRPCGFINRRNINRTPPLAQDSQMPRTPRLALDDALEPGQEIAPNASQKLMAYLETVLSDDQLDDIKAILDGQEVAPPGTAMDRALRRHADRGKRRQDAVADFESRFPLAKRLTRCCRSCAS